nr:CpXC domain-containing protein [Candidatus Freyarchaeota archaeon]
MTRLSTAALECPCGNRLNVVYEASINIWLSGYLIRDLLDGELYNFRCKYCGKVIHLVTKVLINAPSGMFWISTGEEPETLRKIFKERGVIDDKGEVADPLEKLVRLAEKREQTAPEDTQPTSPSEIRKELDKIFSEHKDIPSRQEMLNDLKALFESIKSERRTKTAVFSRHS